MADKNKAKLGSADTYAVNAVAMLGHERLLDDYMLSHSDPEPPLLHELDRLTHLRTIQPRMLSGHLQGALLKMFVRMIRPRLILEIGTFTGYSALAMAEGLSCDEAELHTVEVNDELEPIISSFFSRHERAGQLHLHVGSLAQAFEAIGSEKLSRGFDLVFIDADKREYLDYYEAVLPHVRKGGFILADNVLWDGHVLEEPKPSDRHTRAVKEFNDFVAADTRVEKVIAPIRDGITIMMKR